MMPAFHVIGIYAEQLILPIGKFLHLVPLFQDPSYIDSSFVQFISYAKILINEQRYSEPATPRSSTATLLDEAK
jgi:hypothetical protein